MRGGFKDSCDSVSRSPLVSSPSFLEARTWKRDLLAEQLSAWEVPLVTGDMAEKELPKESVVKIGKLFTTHHSLIAGRFGAIKEEKLKEILGRLRDLFARDEQTADTPQEAARN